MHIREKIKSLLALKCITITKLAELMTEKTSEKIYRTKTIDNYFLSLSERSLTDIFIEVPKNPNASRNLFSIYLL